VVSPINGNDSINKLNGMSSMKDYMGTYKNNVNELDTPGEFLPSDSTGVIKGGISETQNIHDAELSKDLNTLTNKYFTVDDINQLGQNDMSADKSAKAFSKIMNDYLSDVNEKDNASDNAMQTFASGGNIDMHSVMIAAEKANTSMQLTLQLRNKLLQAYQDVSKMQI